VVEEPAEAGADPGAPPIFLAPEPWAAKRDKKEKWKFLRESKKGFKREQKQTGPTLRERIRMIDEFLEKGGELHMIHMIGELHMIDGFFQEGELQEAELLKMKAHLGDHKWEQVQTGPILQERLQVIGKLLEKGRSEGVGAEPLEVEERLK
ncbi:unnamed protein product, partial [Prorocentrum cordatum]